MKIIVERMGFFNMRLVQRMNQIGVSPTQVAQSVRVTYEQIRKLIMGRCLPSDSTLERLCVSLDLNKREMKERVLKDRMISSLGKLRGRTGESARGLVSLPYFSLCSARKSRKSSDCRS